MTLNEMIATLEKIRDKPESQGGEVVVVVTDRKGDYTWAYPPQLVKLTAGPVVALN